MRAHTVLGEIDVNELGVTMCHEHLLFDLTRYLPENTPTFHNSLEFIPVTLENLGAIRRDAMLCRDNLLQLDADLAIRELEPYKTAGGKTIIDCTSIGLGRDIRALEKISKSTGVNVIAGTGFYIDRFHPSYVSKKTVDELASQMIAEIEQGVEGTQIRCGIIGEIGTSCAITTNEKKVLNAAVYAQQKTKVPINIHPDPYARLGQEILNIVQDAGADLTKVVMSHTDACGFDKAYHASLARRGCYVEFDAFGSEVYYDSMGTDQTFLGTGIRDPTDFERVASVCELAKTGYLSQILLSHDVCYKIHLKRYGGYGFDHILRNVIPNFKKSGLNESDITSMLVENPKKLFGS